MNITHIICRLESYLFSSRSDKKCVSVAQFDGNLKTESFDKKPKNASVAPGAEELDSSDDMDEDNEILIAA